MPQQPLVSIIIPTYNRAHLIGETLDSVLAQTYTNWECIVVDDGSTDGTDALMKSYCEKDARFQYHHRPADRLPGGNAARNYGFEVSAGEFVNWFDSDDLMHREKIKLKVESIISTQYNFCVCDDGSFQNKISDGINYLNKPIYSESNRYESFIRKEIKIMTASPLCRKSFLDKFEMLFNENLKASQEWELYTRILFRDSNYLPIDKPLFYIRMHSGSIQGNESLEKKWYRFVTRLQILNEHSSNLSVETINYLNSYLLNVQKSFIRARSYKYFYYSFTHFVLINKRLSIKTKTLSLISFITFVIFKRGDSILKKI